MSNGNGPNQFDPNKGAGNVVQTADADDPTVRVPVSQEHQQPVPHYQPQVPPSGQYQQGQVPPSGQYQQGQVPPSGQYQQGHVPPSGPYQQGHVPPSGPYQQGQVPQSGQVYPSQPMAQPGSTGPNSTGQVAGDYNPAVGAVRVALPNAGEVVAGRYTIIKELGRGGFGAVYHARQIGIDKEVALKILLPSAASIEGASERFRREAMLAKELAHPNTITLHDYGQTPDGLTYIAMEYLEGLNLEEELEQCQKMDHERVRHIASQALKSLAEAHSRGIVHRDLKPSNVMLVEVFGEKDFVKVLDFGIARAFEDHEEDYKTKTGTVIGTPQYMSPEQLKGLEVGPQSDLYSLGLIMAEMASGKVVYGLENTNLVIVAQLSDPNCPIPAEVSSGPLGMVIYNATHKDPEKRYQTAQQMLHAMGSSAPAPEGEETPELASRPMRKAQPGEIIMSGPQKKVTKSKLPLILITTVLLAAAAAGVVIVAMGGEETDDSTPVVETNGTDDRQANLEGNNVTPPPEAPSEEQVAAERDGSSLANQVWRSANMIAMAGAAAVPVGDVRLVLISDPGGAEVFRGDQSIGQTPLNTQVRAGTGVEILRIHKNGFRDEYISIDLSDDAIPETVLLTAEARSTRPSDRTAATSDRGPRDRDRSGRDTMASQPEPAADQTRPSIGVIDDEPAPTPRDRSDRDDRPAIPVFDEPAPSRDDSSDDDSSDDDSSGGIQVF